MGQRIVVASLNGCGARELLRSLADHLTTDEVMGLVQGYSVYVDEDGPYVELPLEQALAPYERVIYLEGAGVDLETDYLEDDR